MFGDWPTAWSVDWVIGEKNERGNLALVLNSDLIFTQILTDLSLTL